MAGFLDEQCTEQIEEKPEADTRLEEAIKQEEGEDENEEEQEDVLDPDDPLYGLDQRLAELDIDEETKAVIKAKLMDASSKIK